MMKKIYALLTFLTLTLFTSCLTIEEIITVHNDGSGSFSQKMDYSELIELVQSMGAGGEGAGELGNLKKSVDSSVLAEIDKLKQTKTLTNFKVDTSNSGFILYSCDFKSTKDILVLKKSPTDKIKDNIMVDWTKNSFKFSNNMPINTLLGSMGEEEKSQLDMFSDQFKYNIQYKFDKKISKSNLKEYTIADDKKSLKIETNLKEIIANPKLMNIEVKF
jgi:hypothetical protein